MIDFTGFGEYSSRDIVVTISGNIDYTIEDLDISIVAKKSLSANPNMATIIIYNLAPSTRDLLSNSVYDSDNNKSVCELTFTLNDEEIYKGDILNVVHSRKAQQGEYETVFYCGDGANAIKEKTNKTFTKGSNVGDIVGELIGDIEGISKGAIQGVKDCLSNRTLLRSLTLDGEIVKNVQKLLKDCTGGDSETDVFISDNQINILARNEILNVPIIDITDDLIDAPKLTEQGANALIRFNTSLKIGASFKIASRNNQITYANLTQNKLTSDHVSGIGTYKVIEITHKIDNFSKEVASTELSGIIDTKVI